jgi:selenocysteine-specific elongation factor
VTRAADGAQDPRAAAGPRHRVVATAGHVDHGKSTLLRALTGAEPDRLAEEQRRGMTLDLGFVTTTVEDPDVPGSRVDVAFVDVPGHERFIGTMLAGCGAGPGVLLVVAADGDWSAQSAEHRDILDLLGARAVALVVTKADLVDDELLAAVRGRVLEEVRGTSLDGAPLVVTDAVSGRGLAELRATLARRLAAMPEPEDLTRPRLWVDRSFTVAGSGTVVTGMLVDGHLEAGVTARLLPSGDEVRVRGLQMLGRDVPSAPPGSRVAANLSGVHHEAVARGSALVTSSTWQATGEVDAEVRLLEGRELGRRGAWRLHVGSAATSCRVRLAYGPVAPGGVGLVRLVLDEPLPLAHGDRIVLRDLGRRVTVGGGRVLDASPPPLPRGATPRAARQELLMTLAQATTPGEALAGLVALGGGMRAADEVGEVGPGDLPPGLRRVGTWIVERGAEERLTAALRGIGEGVHDRSRLVRAVLAAGTPSEAADTWVDALVAAGTLVRVRHGLSLAEHGDDAHAAARVRRDRALAVLEAGGTQPPDFVLVARELGLDHLERVALLGSEDVVRAGTIVFARRAFEQAVAALRALEEASGPFTAAAARTHLGSSRRFAIPLLEAMQTRGLTTFDGTTHRFVGGAAAQS